MKRIRKVSNITPLSGNVVNSLSDSTIDGYSCDFINNLHTYTTNEIRIGTWLGKPLYRKVYSLDVSKISATNENYVDVSGLNIDNTIKVYGFWKQSNGTFSIPLNDSDSNYALIFVSNDNYIRGRISNPSIIKSAYVVLEYTKTTD